tara:strand:- start:375 stop:905 length:531 start_codon:yes stop_codon:yes gene_type:complete
MGFLNAMRLTSNPDMVYSSVNIQQTYDLVVDLLKKHDLRNQGWTFAVSRGKYVLGSCVYKTKTIKISRYLIQLGTDQEVRDTVMHEVGHALAGGKAGHGWQWRQKCREVGLMNPKQYSESISYAVPHKITVDCNVHGVIEKRHRRLKKGMLARMFCRDCGRISKGLLTEVVLEVST